MRPIHTVVVHCALTYPDMDIGVAEINEWHVARGFDSCGYHYVIRRNGFIETGRPLEIPGAHAQGMNSNSIGICLVGGKSRDGRAVSNFTRLQYMWLNTLLDTIKADLPNIEIIGHNDVPGTTKTCPNMDITAYLGE